MRKSPTLLSLLVASALSSMLGAQAFSQDTLPRGCADFTIGAEYSFSPMNGPPRTIDGVAHPLHRGVLFRGISDRNTSYDAALATAAMLGKPGVYVGSPMFFKITEVLKRRQKLNSPLFEGGDLPFATSDYLANRMILDDVNYLLRCNEGGPYQDPLASRLAAELMNRYFRKLGEREIAWRYFDMKAPVHYDYTHSRKGFGNNAIDFIISTAHDQIAAHYGRKILVFRDTRGRALDLGLWNWGKNGFLYDSWLDNGEVNSPGYITGEEILGFQLRKKDRAPNPQWYRGLIPNEIDFAFQKVEFNGKTYVLVLDGSNQLCVFQGSDQRYYKCQLATNYQTIPASPPRPLSERASDRIPLIGAIAVCPRTGECGSLDALFKWYQRRSTRSLPVSLQNEVNGIPLPGGATRYFPNAVEDAPIGIRVVSATFGGNFKGLPTGNATAAASGFCNGKTSCEYKVSSKHLGDPAPGFKKGFSISWVCSGSPDQIRKHVIEADAEGSIYTLSCPSGESIRVKEATFGGNIQVPPKDNVLAQAAAYCNGKESVEYMVSTRFLGDPAPGSDEDFEIIWTCASTGEKLHRIYEASPAEGKKLNLRCP